MGSRKTWHSNGEGYLRGVYHLYAKDDNLSNGYGGYCLSALRPGANSLFHIPGTLLPHVRPNSQGNIVGHRHWVKHPETRSRLSEAMNNEIIMPDGQLWDGRRPWSMPSSPWSMPSSPLRSKSLKSQAVDPEAFVQIIDALRSGLSKPARASRELYSLKDEQGNDLPLQEAVSKAVESGDATVINWALQISQRHDKKPTVGDTSTSVPSKSVLVQRHPCPDRWTSSTTRPGMLASVRKGFSVGTKDIIQFSHEALALPGRSDPRQRPDQIQPNQAQPTDPSTWRPQPCVKTVGRSTSDRLRGLERGKTSPEQHIVSDELKVLMKEARSDLPMAPGKATEDNSAGFRDEPGSEERSLHTETCLGRSLLRRSATQSKHSTRLRHTVLQGIDCQSDETNNDESNQDFTSKPSLGSSYDGFARRGPSRSRQKRQVPFRIRRVPMRSHTEHKAPDDTSHFVLQQASSDAHKALP